MSPGSNLSLVFPNGAERVQNYANIYNRVFKPMLIEKPVIEPDLVQVRSRTKQTFPPKSAPRCPFWWDRAVN
jgi:hypothetical protein